LDDDGRGERVRGGLRIVIVGAPNAGKSTLLNWLAWREAAIVSHTPGTTRDVIEVHLDIAGYAVTVVDTAGIRSTSDIIETEGVRRAQRQAADADIKIVLFDGATWPARDRDSAALVDDNALMVVSKADLLRNKSAAKSADAPQMISIASGAGVENFMTALANMIRARMDTGAATPPLTRARHRRALEECGMALDRTQQASLPELAAEDLRMAARALGRLTGRVEVDEVLDAVFRDFCIGK
jgi:tRNA modification GTPase